MSASMREGARKMPSDGRGAQLCSGVMEGCGDRWRRSRAGIFNMGVVPALVEVCVNQCSGSEVALKKSGT